MSSIDLVIQRLAAAKSVLNATMPINTSAAPQVQSGQNSISYYGQNTGQVATQVPVTVGQGGTANSGGGGTDFGLQYGGEGTQSVYQGDRLTELVTENVTGSGDNRLNELMEDMQTLDPNDRPAVESMMTEIAGIRGTDPDVMINDFDTMTDIMDQNGLSFNNINENLHPDFMGSETSLSYGNVVGSTLGIDPVFGAVMNPSGGLTGPGNLSIPTDPDSAITMHGIAHDASGFLYNSLGIGPGYDYVEDIPGAPWYLNDFLSDTSPVAGQWNGVAYWESVIHNNPVSIGIGTFGDFVDLGTEFIDLSFESGGNWLSNNVPVVGGVLGWGLDGAGNLVGGLGDIVDSGTDIAADFVDSTWDAASDAWDGVTDFAGDTWESASSWASDTWDSLTGGGGSDTSSSVSSSSGGTGGGGADSGSSGSSSSGGSGGGGSDSGSSGSSSSGGSGGGGSDSGSSGSSSSGGSGGGGADSGSSGSESNTGSDSGSSFGSYDSGRDW